MNLLTCAFDFTYRKFLGFVVLRKGREIDHSKIKTILEKPKQENLKELCGLQGCLVCIQRFMSNHTVIVIPLATSWKKEHLLSETSHAVKILRKLRSTFHILYRWER